MVKRMQDRNRRNGFTFIELMVVVSITVILMCLAIPQLTRSIKRSHETVLANNLFTLRTQIQHYCFEKGKAPQNLQDLVSAGYLQTIPGDPMNNDSTDWRIDNEDAQQATDPSQPGIANVHSASDKTGSNGRRYSEW